MRYIEINTAADTRDIPALIFKMPLPHTGQPGGTAHARTEKSCLTTRPAYRGQTFMIRPPPRKRDAPATAPGVNRRQRMRNGLS
jgi:hypothetical protein